ncbi:uncharacterized protein [Ambystoma mexicanum]|uniref:uncharacterized protein n=1 Tax=Ambystoma mexicanum TaxID=8296 RepID=UPI0037E6FDC2
MNKYEFSKSTLKLFGHIFLSEGLQPDPAKVQALAETPTRASLPAVSVRLFPGIASYCTRYVKDFASISTPLRMLTEKRQVFCWSQECEDAFWGIKSCIYSAACMAYYDSDLETEVTVEQVV